MAKPDAEGSAKTRLQEIASGKTKTSLFPPATRSGLEIQAERAVLRHKINFRRKEPHGTEQQTQKRQPHNDKPSNVLGKADLRRVPSIVEKYVQKSTTDSRAFVLFDHRSLQGATIFASDHRDA